MRLIAMLRGLRCGWDQFLFLLSRSLPFSQVLKTYTLLFCPVLDTHTRILLILHSISVGIAT
jgi:hypothetical protein